MKKIPDECFNLEDLQMIEKLLNGLRFIPSLAVLLHFPYNCAWQINTCGAVFSETSFRFSVDGDEYSLAFFL